MLLKKYQELSPVIHGGLVAEDASIIGDVEIGKNASIWYGVVLRGDVDKIVIGENTSIQDNAVAHCSMNLPTIIGKNCVVGHNAMIHSCTVEDECLIGMGAVLLDGCHIGTHSVVAAGAVVSPGTVVPPGSMVMGVPGRVVRQTTEKDILGIQLSVEHYLKYAQQQMTQYDL